MSTYLGIRSETDIKTLAKQLAVRHEEEPRNPFSLFLGVACQREAGVPSLAEMAHQVFDPLYERNPALATTLLPEEDREDENKLVQALQSWLADMTDIERYSVLQTLYSRIPVPLFYQDLAVLIRARYFTYVLTTNIDPLLERALNGVGLERDRDYEVISFRQLSKLKRQQDSSSDSSDTIKIIKLQEDLGEREVGTSEEITAALERLDNFVKSKLQGDIVMVGYEFESKPLNQWLAQTPGGELWWVSPERPTPWRSRSIERMRPVTYINGPNADFEAFFGKLALRLLRLPILEAMTQSFEDYTKQPNVALLGSAGLSTSTSLSDELLETEYLWGQLMHCQDVLYRLRQALIPGERNVRIQVQIEYQKCQITKFGDELRSISSNKSRVIELMEQIIQSAQQTSTDSKTISYLETLLNIVREEYREGNPNQDIISGSINATVLVANRLGSKAVKPDLVHGLRSFATV